MYRVSRKCASKTCERMDESETFSDLTKTEIWRMKQDDLHLSCEERKLRAVQFNMHVDAMRRVLRFYEGIEDQNEIKLLPDSPFFSIINENYIRN